MIKNSVLTFILRLRATNYVRAFWYKMREMVLNYARYARAARALNHSK